MLSIQDPNYFKRIMKIFMMVIMIWLVTFIIAMIWSPSVETFKNMGSKVPSHLNDTEGLNKVWGYILNNGFQVPFQMLILSLIPIPFLYFLNLISTSIITGIVFGFAINFDLNKGMIMVISSIPHMLVEIGAMCFVVSALYQLNISMIRKMTNLFRKHKKQNISFKLAIMDLIKSYLFIALPLFVMAAFLETYLTDFIYQLFT
ncbi:stage II sporulation protein M [Staphylococcus ursi]|uniref:stage II sporulation protein M n=1 Tax=Staphylococcus sp. MI 10-1553 TaxID=1912064 RepID=UPI001398D1FC|nr:stage II sporulation protein M [Staphylococcus sp. MI 10-1553]QHW35935.1 stage II sporulation protein M [Staphylococcus sp. MI 10-1553]